MGFIQSLISRSLITNELRASDRERCRLKIWQTLASASALGLLLAGAASADTLELKDGRVLQGRFLGGTQAVLRFEWNGEVRTFSVNDIVALTFTTVYHDQNGAPPPPPAAQDNGAPPPTQNNATPPASAQDSGAPPSPADPWNANVPDAPAPPATSPQPASPSAPTSPATPSEARSLAAGTPAPVAPGSSITLPVDQSLLIRMIDSVDSKKNNVGDVFHASLETDLTVNGVLVASRGADVYGKLAYAKEADTLAGVPNWNWNSHAW